MRPALMVLVDDPALGVPGITDDPAEADALLATALERVRQVPRVGRLLLFHPPDAESRLVRRSLGFRLWPQRGTTPGERYANAFGQALELGYEGAVAIGLETPLVSVDVMTQATSLLEEHQGAVVSDGRGRIALLALQEPQPTILSGPSRGGYDEVVNRARQQRIRLVELPSAEDLDPGGLADVEPSPARG